MSESEQVYVARVMAYGFSQAARGPWHRDELSLALSLCQVALQWADRSGHTQNIDTCVENIARIRALMRSSPS